MTMNIIYIYINVEKTCIISNSWKRRQVAFCPNKVKYKVFNEIDPYLFRYTGLHVSLYISIQIDSINNCSNSTIHDHIQIPDTISRNMVLLYYFPIQLMLSIPPCYTCIFINNVIHCIINIIRRDR